MTIILDAMGTDEYPDPEIYGSIDAAKILNEKIILVGNEEILRPKLVKASPGNPLISIHHASEVVEMWDKPVESARSKPNNSMAIGIKLLKENTNSAFVTAGNTGGAMFNALRVLGRIKGVQRPALSGIFPTKKEACIVVDLGANADCRPDFLLQFAIMGSIYAKYVLNKDNPRVGLLSNGEETGKGNQLVKETYKLLEKSDLNFIGNVEGKELFGGDVDVVVTDGFTGNVMVKSSEAVAELITSVLKEELMKTTMTKIGGFLAKKAFAKMKSIIDPSEIGAAPFLGIDGLVFVGHGRSDARAITSALLLASSTIKKDLITHLRENIAKNLKIN